MTNREVLIHDLTNHTEESDFYLASYINCPYHHSSDCLNHQRDNHDTNSVEYEENCCECKAIWLEKEFEG